jgi:hypothetical protein
MEYEMTAEDRAKYERLERAVADLTAISAEFKALSEGHETIQNLLGPAFLDLANGAEALARVFQDGESDEDALLRARISGLLAMADLKGSQEEAAA